jgi:hypothetical protein
MIIMRFILRKAKWFPNVKSFVQYLIYRKPNDTISITLQAAYLIKYGTMEIITKLDVITVTRFTCSIMDG